MKSQALEIDGRRSLVGPIELAGSHRVVAVFGGTPDADKQILERLRQSAWHPAFVELALEDGAGLRCLRVALVGAEPAPSWRLADDSPGFFMGVGARVFPSGLVADDALEPIGGFEERLGVVFGPHRLWAELAALGTGSVTSNHLLGALGADRVFAQSGPWAFRLGFAYESVFNFQRERGGQAAEHRYTLHGPRFTLGVGYLFQRRLLGPFQPHPGFDAGQRTLALELEAPVSIWFGSGERPPVTIVPGIGVGLVVAL